MAKRVTIIDVAKLAGVSISTVSTALSGGTGVSPATRQRIVKIAEESGWVPSLRGRSLSGNRAYAVGLVVERSPEVLEADPFLAGFIGGVESVLEKRGYALVLQLATSRRRMVERYRELALDHRVDGVFLTDIAVRDARVPLLRELGIPTVAVNAKPATSPFPTVNQDSEGGLRALMDHLIALGHRHIGHVAGAKGMIDTVQRESAWRSALARARLPIGPVFRGDFTIESGAAAADALTVELADPPTAVMCANDLMAIGFIARASQLGLTVPHDVSVTGFDGIQLGSFMRPTLTTLATSPRDLGHAGASLLLDSVEGLPRKDVNIQPVELVLRESVDRPRARSSSDGLDGPHLPAGQGSRAGDGGQH